MPDLPLVSGRQLIQTLEQLAFRIVRQRGSHVVMRRGSKTCVVPLHKEVKLGTLRGVLKQAGLTAEEFLSAFGG